MTRLMHRSKKMAFLFDHLGGAGEKRRWYSEAGRLRGLELDDKLVLCRRFHWHVGGLLAVKDAIEVAGGAAVVTANRQDRNTASLNANALTRLH
jgi:hypothetical protein